VVALVLKALLPRFLGIDVVDNLDVVAVPLARSAQRTAGRRFELHESDTSGLSEGRGFEDLDLFGCLAGENRYGNGDQESFGETTGRNRVGLGADRDGDLGSIYTEILGDVFLQLFLLVFGERFHGLLNAHFEVDDFRALDVRVALAALVSSEGARVTAVHSSASDDVILGTTGASLAACTPVALAVDGGEFLLEPHPFDLVRIAVRMLDEAELLDGHYFTEVKGGMFFEVNGMVVSPSGAVVVELRSPRRLAPCAVPVVGPCADRYDLLAIGAVCIDFGYAEPTLFECNARVVTLHTDGLGLERREVVAYVLRIALGVNLQ